MAVKTSSAFFELLEQSELLDKAQLAKARELAGDSDAPKEIARLLIKQGLLTNWQASMLVNGRSNLHLGKYRLLERISSGELGHVFRAEHAQMGRQVAVRTLSRLQTKDPQAIKQFLAEARQIAALDHRNLIHVYDVDSEGDRYYLVSEFVDGEDLQSRVDQRGPLAPEQAARYIRQAALGLAHAHERDIVHGDIKPSNLLIDSQDSVRVLDVGVARIAQSNGKLAEDETSANFRAPEQAAGDYDHRADIYALGRTLYFLLTGQVALSKNSGADVGLLRICQKMVAKDPEQRFQTATEAADALAAWEDKNQGGGAAAEAASKKSKKPPVKASNPKVAVALPDNVAFGEVGGVDLGIDTTAASNPQPPSQSAPPIKNQPAAPQSSQPAVAAPKRAGVPPWAFLAGAGGLLALFLLIGVGVGAYVLLFGSTDETAVAQANQAEQSASAMDPSDPEYVDPEAVDPEAASSKSEGYDPEADPELAPEAAPPTVETESGDETAAEPTADATSEDSTDDKSDGGKAAGADPSVFASAGGSATTKPAPENPAAAGNDDSPKTTEPKTTEPKPTEPKPAESEPATPKPAEPDKPTPSKTTPPKEEPKPAPPPNPFRKLTQHLALPTLDTSDEPAAGAFEPQPLGELFVKPGELFFVELHGGEAAYAGSRAFALVPNLTTERDWDVVMSRGAAESLKVAQLSVKDDKLWFQWLPEATEDPAAANFANCVLAMRTSLATHWSSLRVPVEAPPMEFELSKGTARVDYQIDAAPEADKVMVEIAALEGFPEHVFDPEQAIPAADETTFVRFGMPPEQVLSLKIDTKMRKGIRAGVQISAGAHYKLEGMPRDERFVEKDFKNMQAKVTAQHQQLGVVIDSATKQLQKFNNKQKQQKQQLSQQILLWQNQLPVLEAQKKQVEAVAAQLAAIQPVGKIHFRIYINAGEYQVDLLRSDSLPKQQPAPKDGKSAKPQPPAK